MGQPGFLLSKRELTELSRVFIDPDFMPFTPPPGLLGLRGLRRLCRNYMEVVPRPAYEQGVTRMPKGKSEFIFVCEPAIIEEILVEKPDAFVRDPTTMRIFAPVVGAKSLFLAQGAEWRWQRRAMAPIFRHDMLQSFMPIFSATTQRQVDRWRAAPHDQPVDVAAGMIRTSADIIIDALLGGPSGLDVERYLRVFGDYFDSMPWHLIYASLSIPTWMPYPRRAHHMRQRDFLYQDVLRIVERRRGKPAERTDLLDLLLAAHDPETGRYMSDEEIVANLLTLITAGHETSAVAVTWALWFLAKDQASQQRVYDEVTAVAKDGPIEGSHVEQLTFTRQVLQEALRLFPPAPGIVRLPIEAMEIGGMQIGKRARLHIPIFALHRNERLWDHPNAFDPDRFAADRVKARPRNAFLPFGDGPRICIGWAYAMMEAVVVLATVVRGLRFRPVAGHKPKVVARFTLRPANGMPLLVSPR